MTAQSENKAQEQSPRLSPSARALAELNRQRKELLKDVTLDQRRAFISALRAGTEFLEAAKAVGISFEQALEVKRRNTKKTVHLRLAKPEEVK